MGTDTSTLSLCRQINLFRARASAPGFSAVSTTLANQNLPKENVTLAGVQITLPANAQIKLNAKFAFNQVTPRGMNNAHLTLKNVRILILCSTVLSNFYRCEISVFGENYNSAEQAFQCVKAVRSGDLLAADKIRAAKSALEAKKIGNLVTPSDSWISSRVEVMSEIISKKAEQVETFRETLENSTRNAVFAETTFDDFWATGLNFDQSVHTKPSAWPGKNVLGQILGRAATEIKKKQKTKSKSGSPGHSSVR